MADGQVLIVLWLLLHMKHKTFIHLFIYSIGGDPTSNETEELFDSVYTNFVEEVDAVDNGIESRDGLPRLAMRHEFA